MRLSTLFASTVLATFVATSAASAAAIPFTWSPTGAGLSTDAGTFTASHLTIVDYALINAQDAAHVHEDAILQVVGFNTSTPGLVTPSGVVGTANPYTLYFTVHTESHLSGAPNNLSGAFDSLSYTLWGNAGNDCSFAATFAAGPTATCTGASIALATGGLATNGSHNQVHIVNGVPDAAVDVSVTSVDPSFWLSPTFLSNLLFQTSFINNDIQVTVGSGADAGKFLIGGCDVSTSCPGGGTFDLVAVPEPLTLSLFGAGLAGAAALRRRKANKA